MVLSEPVRIHVCDHRGSCVSVDFATRRTGNVIELKQSEVTLFVERVQEADDRLSEDEDGE